MSEQRKREIEGMHVNAVPDLKAQTNACRTEVSWTTPGALFWGHVINRVKQTRWDGNDRQRVRDRRDGES